MFCITSLLSVLGPPLHLTCLKWGPSVLYSHCGVPSIPHTSDVEVSSIPCSSPIFVPLTFLGDSTLLAVPLSHSYLLWVLLYLVHLTRGLLCGQTT